MKDPKRKNSREDRDEEGKPKIERETLKDLDPKERSSDVKGGQTTVDEVNCEATTM